MKLKSMMIAAVAVLFALSSCSKTDEGAGNSDDGLNQKVKIQISDGTPFGSRAAGSHVVDASAVTFSGGYLMFANVGGTILKQLTITNDAAVPTPTSVGINTLKTGATIENVPAGCTQIYFLGNKPSAMAAPTQNSNISAVKNYAATVESQYDATNMGVEKVTLWGSGAIVAVAVDYEAKFKVSPIAARMEIGKITADVTGTYYIKSFAVEGIYMNNYYSSINLDGSMITLSTPKDNGIIIANYKGGAGSYTGTNGIVHDYVAAGIGSFNGGQTLILSPKNVDNVNDVWGYNLLALAFADETIPAVTPAGYAVPNIAICIKDIVLTDGITNDAITYAGTHFISIGNLYKAGSTIPIDFMPRNVYRIPNLSFDQNDLTANPFEKTKKVAVEVTMLPWNSADIDYDYN